MPLSSSTAKNINNTLKVISKNYNSQMTSEGFFINDEAIIKHGEACFKYWDFSKNINIVTVEDRNGESFLGNIGNPASSRTDVSKQDRETYSLLSPTTRYNCAQMNTDVSVKYPLLNKWSASSSRDFSKSYVDYTLQRVGIDRLIAGWHGSEQTNPNTSPTHDPLLRNLSMGWLASMIDQRPERVLASEAGQTIMIGSANSADANFVFKNLDEAVISAIAKIPPLHRNNLVCLIGDELLAQEQMRVYGSDSFIYEKHKNEAMFNSFGNIPRLDCIGFPSLGLVVTSRDNLSIYIKSGTAFRQFRNNVKREQIEDYQTCELAYVVENPLAFFAFDPVAVRVPALNQYAEEEHNSLRENLDHHAANIN